jgi:hypothetical protein
MCFSHEARSVKKAGAFQRDIDAIGAMRQVGGIALGSHLDALAVDDQIVAIDFDRALKAAVDAVALEQHRIGLGRGQIVDRDQFEVMIGALRMARATLRPMRPKPLIATLIAM